MHRHVIKEIKMKVRCHYTSVRMATIIKRDHDLLVRVRGNSYDKVHRLNHMIQPLHSWVFSKKADIHTNPCTQMFTAALLVIAPHLATTQMSKRVEKITKHMTPVNECGRPPLSDGKVGLLVDTQQQGWSVIILRTGCHIRKEYMLHDSTYIKLQKAN